MSVKITWKGETFEFTGDSQSTARQVERFLLKTLPEIALAKKLLVSLDAKDLAEIVSPLIKITEENKIITNFPRKKVSVSDRILILLISQKLLYVGNLAEGDKLTLREISNVVLASSKSTSSRLSELYSKGLVEKERNEEVKYRVTIQGILNFKQTKRPRILKKISQVE